MRLPSGLELSCHVAFEATGDYHRILANFLHTQGFKLHLVSSIATARTRDALYNTWDKNDAKDAQVILHLLKTGAYSAFLYSWRELGKAVAAAGFAMEHEGLA